MEAAQQAAKASSAESRSVCSLTETHLLNSPPTASTAASKQAFRAAAESEDVGAVPLYNALSQSPPTLSSAASPVKFAAHANAQRTAAAPWFLARSALQAAAKAGIWPFAAGNTSAGDLQALAAST